MSEDKNVNTDYEYSRDTYYELIEKELDSAIMNVAGDASVDEDGTKHYEIYGPLFFGSVQAFAEKFDIATDPDVVIIDFRESRVNDMSGIEALNKITERYTRAGKELHLRHLSPDCLKLLKNAEKIIDVNIIEDPTYKVAVEI